LPVEFVICTTDLRDVTKQLQANREEHNDSDFVDIMVSNTLATFRSVGADLRIPVDGKGPGSARIPLRIVDKINVAVETFKTKELIFRCERGFIKVGSLSVKHPDIEEGVIASQHLSLPVDLSVLDTLALAQMFDWETIVREGLRPRVEKARDARTQAVIAAHATLEVFGVTGKQLDNLIDGHVKNAVEKLRPTLRIT
jgi:hypothetical protein